MTTLETKRLILRPWKKSHLAPFAILNADPRVMEYFPSILSSQESDDFAKHICAEFEKKGWGRWAVSLSDIAEFIGFIGLSETSLKAHFTPAIEIVWRLAYDFWG